MKVKLTISEIRHTAAVLNSFIFEDMPDRVHGFLLEELQDFLNQKIVVAELQKKEKMTLSFRNSERELLSFLLGFHPDPFNRVLEAKMKNKGIYLPTKKKTNLLITAPVYDDADFTEIQDE